MASRLADKVAAASTARVRDLISGPARPADVLGRFATALYLRLANAEVIALLSSDAVRLPIGLILPTSSRQFPLTRLTERVMVGSGAVHVGDWSCRVSQLISPRAPAGLTPDRGACEHLRHRLTQCASQDLDLRLPDPLPECTLLWKGTSLASTSSAHMITHSPDVAADLVRRFLGTGSGLTPAGDDVLAGLLVGLWSFGQRADPLRLAVLAGLPTGTTDLSAALLRGALRGESIPQVNQLLRVLSGNAWQSRLDKAVDDIIHVGHTSGTALATGVWAAAIAIGGRRQVLVEAN
jgi:hypothetical protein